MPQRRVFQIVELLPKSCSSHQSCSAGVLSHKSAACICVAHTHTCCAPVMFLRNVLALGFFWGAAVAMHMLPCTWANYSNWSWRQEGLGRYITSLKFLICSFLGPRKASCFSEADLSFCHKVLPPSPSPCSSPDAFSVFANCGFQYDLEFGDKLCKDK